MIPKKFHLFWCGNTMSYLRYMTLVTLRKYHPDWEINLHTSQEYVGTTWANEAQDFQQTFTDDFLQEAQKIADNVYIYNKYTNLAPNFQSDFFRWDILESDGGFYLDTDQIILKPFDNLLAHQFIYASYTDNTPVGVLGAEQGLQITQYIKKRVAELYSIADYSSIGPPMFRRVMIEIKNKKWWVETNSWNSEFIFYPIAYSYDVSKIYNGEHKLPPNAYALHWFGGHPDSQKFNKLFTPSFVKTSKDTISCYLRSYIL